jgi:SAM-dependent methyltransferase
MSYLRRGCDVTFCDIVPANVMMAAQRIVAQGASDPTDGRRATATLLDASAPLPFPDAAFDVASAHGVLHHIADPSPVVDEFFRVLRPGGWLYVMLYTESLAARCEPIMAGLMTTGRSREQAFGAVTDGSGCPFARPYTDEEGRRLLERTGFAVDRVIVYNDGDFRTFRGRKP